MIALDPRLHARLVAASQAFHDGRMSAAVAGYRALLAAEPRLPDSWFNLSIAERATGESDAALASLDRALAHDLEGPEEAHLRRALILVEDRHDAAGARGALETALAVAPDYVAAWLNLGNLEEDVGDRAAARRAYARAHALAPDDALALARLVTLDDAAPLRELAKQRLADRALPPLARADLGFALAGALDRAGDHRAAFAAADAANAASRGVNAAAGARYDRAATDALVDALIDVPVAGPAIAPPDDGPAPVFVCGHFRSGSTLAEQLLAREGGIHPAGELTALATLVGRVLQPYPQGLASLTDAQARELRRMYRAAVAPFHPAGARFTDKRPDNIFHVALIRRLFPEARIVCTVRDARDVAVSLWFLHAGPGLPYATDLGDIAHHGRAVARLTAHWREAFGDAVHVLDYDRLIAAPEREIADLLAFVGSEPGTSAAAPSIVRTASQWQVRRPLYASSSGRWRHYARELAAAGLVEGEGAMRT